MRRIKLGWHVLASVLLPISLGAQVPQPARDPDDLAPINGFIRDSLDTFWRIHELKDGRVLIPENGGPVLIADFATGHVKRLSGLDQGGQIINLFGLGGDTTLLQGRNAWLLLNGTEVVATIPVHMSRGETTPIYIGADTAGFVLTIRGRRPDDSARIIRIARKGGSETEIARVWLRPLLGFPFADLREQAVLASDGWIAVFRARPFRIDWRSPDGVWTFNRPMALPELPMDDHEKAEIMAKRAPFMAPGTNTPDHFNTWPAMVDLFSGPDILKPTPEGNVLVARTPVADAHGSLYDVVDRNGQIIREFDLPIVEKVVGFGAHSIYIRTVPIHGANHLERRPWP